VALAYFNFLQQGNPWFLNYFDLFFTFFFAFGTEITCRYNVPLVGLTSGHYEVLSALPDLIVFFLFVCFLSQSEEVLLESWARTCLVDVG